MKIKRIFSAVLIILLTGTLAQAAYAPHARLLIKNINFCTAKPRSLGRFEPVGEEGFKSGEAAYLYMEAENCKPERSGTSYELYLILDMDMYYEDGTLVYSEKDVKSFNPTSPREFSKTMLWIKIDTQYLRPGEYKVELRVRDENSGKDTFALKKFNVH